MIRGRMLTNHLQSRRAWRGPARETRHAAAQQHYDRMYWSDNDHFHGVSYVQRRFGMFTFEYKTA